MNDGSLAVPNFDIMSTVGYTLKSMSTFLWCNHTCWGVCWTEIQNFAGIGISFFIFYCTAVSGRKAKYIAHALMKIIACSWVSISLLPFQVIALQVVWEFCIPLGKGKDAHAFHLVLTTEIKLWGCSNLASLAICRITMYKTEDNLVAAFLFIGLQCEQSIRKHSHLPFRQKKYRKHSHQRSFTVPHFWL